MIRAYTVWHEHVRELSRQDADRVRFDLIAFGLYLIQKDEHGARRIDPRDVAFDCGQWQLKKSRLDEFGLLVLNQFLYHSPLRDAAKRMLMGETVVIESGRRSEKKTWFDIVQKLWEPSKDSLPIWRKHDPGAQ
jgi:hypothetical protein